jgi:LPS-assembly lipoprotein
MLLALPVRLLPLGLLLSGCGFHPLYAARGDEEGPAEAGLAAINIALIPERSGQILRLALQQRLQQGGGPAAPRYDLAVSLAMSSSAIAIQANSTPSRVRLIGTANWTLRAEDTAQSTMTSGTARVVDGFDEIDSQAFAADLESEAVQKRIFTAIADKIALQLAEYFDRHASSRRS